jgi:hypothetical protein
MAAFSQNKFNTTQTRNKRIVRYILFGIEKQVSGSDFDFDADTFNIEHVLPENPGEGWEYISDRDHEQLVYRLGNMTPMLTSQNRNIGNSSFDLKRDTLAASQFSITAKIAADNNVWNAERIAVRQKWLATQAVSIWKVSQLSQ